MDFADPGSISGAIPRAHELIREAEQRVAAAVEEAQQAYQRAGEAETEAQRLRAILTTLEQLDAETPPPDGEEQGTSKDRVLKIVIAINGPTNIAEVAEHMPEFSRKTVSWALWKLADEGVIQRLDHGRYAPTGYVPGRPTTNYLRLPPHFPSVSQAQIDQAAEEARARARPR